MDAVKGLLDKYNLADPASPEIGVFQNDFLQALFFDLIAWGSQSEADALLVGCAIEEIDLIDLANRMAQIDNRDILSVFQNLTDGSENHLRAFVRNYESLTGKTYIPLYLDQNTYQQIINGTARQRWWRGGGKGGPGGRWWLQNILRALQRCSPGLKPSAGSGPADGFSTPVALVFVKLAHGTREVRNLLAAQDGDFIPSG